MSIQNLSILSLFKADTATCAKERDRAFNISVKSKAHSVQRQKENSLLGLEKLCQQLKTVLRVVSPVRSSLLGQPGPFPSPPTRLGPALRLGCIWGVVLHTWPDHIGLLFRILAFGPDICLFPDFTRSLGTL